MTRPRHRLRHGRYRPFRLRTVLELSAAGLLTAVAAVSVALVATPVAGATTFTVTNCNDSGTGSLRLAVASASAGDSVDFSASLSPCTANTITLTSGLIEISKNLTITGPGAGTLAVSGGGTSTVFQVDSGVTAGISGLTIEDGAATSAVATGGGVDNAGTLTLSDSIVSNSSATGTTSSEGGGIANTGSMTITDTTVTNNTAAVGGGVANITDLSSMIISDSTIAGNHAPTGAGGGIDNEGTLKVTDSTIAGNGAPDDVGGGIANVDTATVDDSTVSGNSALTGTGGGIDNGEAATFNIAATIVADNSGGGCANDGTWSDQGYNIDDDGSCGLSGTSTSHSLTLDASLVALAGNGGPTQTVALLPGSPAIGLVSSTTLCATPDQRGVTRPTPVCDSGAYQSLITLTPTPLSAATAEFLYSQQLMGHGGTAAYTFAVTAGSLPSWASLSTAGLITGTPTAPAGPVSFTVTATDANGFSGEQPYSLSVVAPTITLSPTSLPGGTWETPYAATTISASGGVGPYAFSVPPGSLPTGLSLNGTTGVVSGTPTAKSQIGTTFSFTVTATDHGGFKGTRGYSITVASPCGAGLTPYFLSATAHTGNFTGFFCVNGSGTGTYTQGGGPTGTGTVTITNWSTGVTAYGTDLALVGQKTSSWSQFTESAPSPEKSGTFTLL